MTRTSAIAATIIAVLALCLPATAYGQKLVFVVRHAERADRGMMKIDTDPGLSTAGQARAAKLAAILADSGIKAIYATEFRRTQDTAGPLAARLGLPVQRYSSKDSGALVAALRKEHAGDIVFVVGHSNTVPEIIKALCGAGVTIAETEYDNLFIVVPTTGTMTRIRFTP